MAVDPNLLEYYSDLLIVQYQDQPNMIATAQLLVNQSLCDGLPQELQTCFDLNSAVGDQLTIIGEIVGVPRNIFGLDLQNTFFNYTDYVGEPAAIGFGSYTESPYPTSLFRSYFDSATYTMTDAQMQQVIQLKILFNNCYSSTKDIVAGLWELFGNYVSYIDNKNMTVTINVVNPYQTIFIIAQYLNIIPRPMGVGLTLNLFTDFLYDQQGNILYDQQGYPLYSQQ
jgi:hypothetical protein